MISPDELDDGEEMCHEMGALIVKWAERGVTPEHILASLHTVSLRTFAATTVDEETFRGFYTENARNIMWNSILRIRREISENKC